MKKILLSLLTLSIALSAGLAFAYAHDDHSMPREEMRRPDFDQQQRRMPLENFNGRGRGFNARDYGRPCERFSRNEQRHERGFNRPDFDDRHCGNFYGHHEHTRGFFITPGMTPEIKAKAVELAKLKIDLEAAFTDKPLDKAKIINIYKAMSAIEQDINIWRFERRLNFIEERARQIELNRTVPTGAPKIEETEETSK